MAKSWSGRLSRRPEDAAAQAAQDGAVSAFLDLDGRQSYVADAMAALAEAGGPGGMDGSSGPHGRLAREWAPIAQQCLDVSAAYLEVANRFSLADGLDRPTRVDPVAAQSAFTEVHRGLADAATAVDAFYRRHSTELERARTQRAAAPRIAEQARQDASAAEQALTKADAEGYAYPSVLDAAGELVTAMAALNAADSAGKPGAVRQAATAVHEAAKLVTDRIVAARALMPTVRSSLSSVKTRLEAVSTRLDTLPATRSALLREFAAASSNDLLGADERARAALQQARTEWQAAGQALDAGQPETAAERLAAARSRLSAAEADHAALTERLRVLRATKADPESAAKATRFRLRDAQLLVVNRGLIREWGSVLDAQGNRIERAVADLTGPHPDYWAYLQALAGVESFVKGIVDRVRGEVR